MTNSTYPWGNIPERSYFYPRFERVVHVIRSPMDQISAFTVHSDKSYDFVLQQMKHLYANTSILAEFEEVQSSSNLTIRIFISIFPFLLSSIRHTRAKEAVFDARILNYVSLRLLGSTGTDTSKGSYHSK